MSIVKKIDIKAIIFILIPILITIYCFNENFKYVENYNVIDLWILPLLYTICEIISYREIKKSKRIGAWAISIVSFFRYVVTIFLYYCDVDNAMTYYMNNKSIVAQIMSFEIISIYSLLYFYSKYNKDNKIEVRKKQEYSFGNVTVVACVIGYILIVLRNPNIIFKKGLAITSTIDTVLVLVSNFASIIITLLLLKKVKNLKISNITKILISLIISIIFSISLSMSDSSISRWTIILNLIVFISILKEYYVKSNNLINLLLVGSLCILLIISTVLKFRW